MPKSYTSSELYELVAFSPMVFARLVALPGLVSSMLRWRSTSGVLLLNLICALENETSANHFITIPHADLSQRIWPDLDIESGKNKLARWLKNFDEDQYLSGFNAVWRKPGHYKKRGDEKEFVPSRYALNQFYDFTAIVGARMREAGILEKKTLKERDQGQRLIVAEALQIMNAGAILPAMRDESRQRVAKSKEKGKLEGRIRDAKNGVLDMPLVDILSLMLPSDRQEILLGRLLESAELFYDTVLEMESPDDARRMAQKIGQKLEHLRERAMEKRILNDRKQWQEIKGVAA